MPDKVIRLKIEGDNSPEVAQHALSLHRHLADLLALSEGRPYAVYQSCDGLFITPFDWELPQQLLYVSQTADLLSRPNGKCLDQQWWRGISVFFAL